MSKVAAVMLSIALLGTGLLTWAFTQNAYLGLVSGGVTGGRLAASIATSTDYLTKFLSNSDSMNYLDDMIFSYIR
ncbi:MAG TPA: hypothetical protein VFE98_05845 [Candidatus Bathyarchaeia archaeon]|nr:hypothetical protein [Candidatus Bathyarchaeia archaeon]